MTVLTIINGHEVPRKLSPSITSSLRSSLIQKRPMKALRYLGGGTGSNDGSRTQGLSFLQILYIRPLPPLAPGPVTST